MKIFSAHLIFALVLSAITACGDGTEDSETLGAISATGLPNWTLTQANNFNCSNGIAKVGITNQGNTQSPKTILTIADGSKISVVEVRELKAGFPFETQFVEVKVNLKNPQALTVNPGNKIFEGNAKDNTLIIRCR